MFTYRISEQDLLEMQQQVGTGPFDYVKTNRLTPGDEVLEWLDTFGCTQENNKWLCYVYQPKEDPSAQLPGYPRFSPENPAIAIYVNSQGRDIGSTITSEGPIYLEGATSLLAFTSAIIYSLMF